jgi:hypothetical protein
MKELKYGDKAHHDQHGHGTVLNTWYELPLVQFWPDKNRPNGPTVSVHPVSLTKISEPKDMTLGFYYIQWDGYDCEELNADNLAEAIERYKAKTDNETVATALWINDEDNGHTLLADNNGQQAEPYGVTTYHVADYKIYEWLDVLNKLS